MDRILMLLAQSSAARFALRITLYYTFTSQVLIQLHGINSTIYDWLPPCKF